MVLVASTFVGGMIHLIIGIGKPTIHKVIDGAAILGEPIAYAQKHGEVAPQVGFGFFQLLFGELRVEIGDSIHFHKSLHRTPEQTH